MAKQISVSLNAEDEGAQNNENDKSGNDEYDRYACGKTFVSMELQLIAMNEKVAVLMNKIEELMASNRDLESSKLRLIANTASAMNECNATIRELSAQNNELKKRIANPFIALQQ